MTTHTKAQDIHLEVKIHLKNKQNIHPLEKTYESDWNSPNLIRTPIKE